MTAANQGIRQSNVVCTQQHGSTHAMTASYTVQNQSMQQIHIVCRATREGENPSERGPIDGV